MPLSEAQKINIRRHLGYPITGNPAYSPIGGATLMVPFQRYRFFSAYGLLEYRLNWAQALELAYITGLATASVNVTTAMPAGSSISAGLALALRFLVGSIDETVEYTTQSGDTVFTIGGNIANAILGDTILATAGFESISPLTGGAFSAAAKPPATVQPYPGIQITSPEEFVLTVQSASPVNLSVNPGSGSFSAPTAVMEDSDGNAITYRGFLQILDALQGKIAGTSDNLDTEKADVWTARKDEMDSRIRLYTYWRTQLAQFLEVPLFEDSNMSVVGQRRSRTLVA